MKKEYETPLVQLYVVKLRSSVLQTTGGDDDPTIED